MSVEKIFYKNDLLALILRNSFDEPGISFFTDDSLSQQLGFLKHPKGKIIQPHIHNPVKREVIYTQETLFIKKGKLKATFYNENKEFLESKILEAGDVILLIKGGHGFEVLEDVSIIEVKQGPYAGEKDKVRFNDD